LTFIRCAIPATFRTPGSQKKESRHANKGHQLTGARIIPCGFFSNERALPMSPATQHKRRAGINRPAPAPARESPGVCRIIVACLTPPRKNSSAASLPNAPARRLFAFTAVGERWNEDSILPVRQEKAGAEVTVNIAKPGALVKPIAKLSMSHGKPSQNNA